MLWTLIAQELSTTARLQLRELATEAFLAADANEQIGNYHLRQAAQLEYESMGKLGAR